MDSTKATLRLDGGEVDLANFFGGGNYLVVPAGEGRYSMWGGNVHRFLGKAARKQFYPADISYVEVTDTDTKPGDALAMLPEEYCFTSLTKMLARIAEMIESGGLDENHLNHFYEAGEDGKVKWETVVWYAAPSEDYPSLPSGWIVRRTLYVNQGTYCRGDRVWSRAPFPEEEVETAA